MLTRSALFCCAFLICPAVRADDAQALQKLQEENRRLRDEALRSREQAVQSREETIRALQRLQVVEREMEKLRAERTAIQVQAEAMAERMRTLEQRCRELEIALARVQAGPAPVRGGGLPPEKIEGKVLRVDGGSNLLHLDVGSDAGLKAGHRLELFRIGDRPENAKYLGQVEILQVRPRDAVARPVNRLLAPPQMGDRVGSQLLEKK